MLRETMFQKHGLKLLNLSVVFYIISGAALFHWLGEFRPSQSGIESDASGANSSLSSSSSPAPAKSIGELRLNSVRRMWNITNQLNILYEANWTELVLAELIDFERQFVDSLEQLSSSPELAQEGSAGDQDNGDGGNDDDDGEESDKDQGKKRRKNGNGGKNSGAKRWPQSGQKSAAAAEERIRVESIKKSLVHSLATITTMGSPIRQPASQLGRLLTVVYGSLGIPLLLVTVAKSGQHLARSSLNALLYIRHYCLTLPIHYLCCSCNLLVCLRLLSWCCCCCCCSYLFCLNDKKRTKCCDFSNAPKLKLHREQKSRQSQRRRQRRRQQQQKCSEQLAIEPGWKSDDELRQQRLQDEAAPGGTYVIGFNLQQMSQNERRKSVRFDEKRERSPPASGPDEDDSDDDDEDYHSSSSEEEDQDEAWRLLASSLAILLAYVMLGALYHAHQHDLPLVNALFACFSMLSTSKLPESFQLDGADPIALYKSRSRRAASSRIVAEGTSKLIASDDLALILDSLYLLAGLNMIAACAQFGRLWFEGATRRRFATCPGKKRANSDRPGPSSSGSLMGSFGQQNSSFAGQDNFQSPPAAQRPARNEQPLDGYQIKQLALLSAAAGEAPSSPPCSASQLAENASQVTPHPDMNQLALSELFVLNPADRMGCSQLHYQPQPQHSDGASFASSSSLTAVAPSLCAHHQATAAAVQNTLERQQRQPRGHPLHHHLSHSHNRNQNHHHNHRQHSQTNGFSDCPSSVDTSSQPTVGVLHQSSSMMQLFDTPQAELNRNSSAATLTRRKQATPTYKSDFQQNGAAGRQQEPDSSPNTFDITTTNSQTISSSASSRAANTVMKPSRFVADQPLSAAATFRAASEKAVSWFEADGAAVDDKPVTQY